MTENEDHHAVLKKLLAKKENNVCFDCSTRNPKWASVNNGVFICLECAGVHRSIGVHLSFVRSVDFDQWKPHEIQLMKNAGNDKAKKFFQSHGIAKLPIDKKYKTTAAIKWREKLKTGTDKTKPKATTVSEEQPQQPEPVDEWKIMEEEARKDGEKKNQAANVRQSSVVVRSTRSGVSSPSSGNKRKTSRRRRNRGGLGSMMNEGNDNSENKKQNSPNVSQVYQPATVTSSLSEPSSSSASTFRSNGSKWEDTVDNTAHQVEQISIGSSMNKNHRNTTPPSSNTNTPGLAQERFGSAKSISSRQFFGNQSGDNEEEQIRERLKSMEGAKSISSADLYGTRSNSDEVDYGRVIQEGVTNISTAASEYGEMVSSTVSKYWSDIKTNYLN
eukprot:gb/GECH01012118.1/.p1 GENE.gb/GECH01012118.1/~~gb/GECH01012118.1/.p1  ORF type:complete len:387 (+),score=91.93 gb/GECH01012118.1/:1-1161(+)